MHESYLSSYPDLNWLAGQSQAEFVRGYLQAGFIERLLIRMSLGLKQVQEDYAHSPERYSTERWFFRFSRGATTQLLERDEDMPLDQVLLQSNYTALYELS